MASTLRNLATAVLAASTLCVCGPAAAQSFVVGSGNSVDVADGGSIDLDCAPLDVRGVLNLNAGQFSTGSDVAIAGGGVVNGGHGTLRVGGELSNDGTFNAQAGSVVMNDGCIGTASRISGSFVFENLTFTSRTARTLLLPAGTQITVLHLLTVEGEPGRIVHVAATGGGEAVIQLGPQATVASSFATVVSVRIGVATDATQAIPSLSEYGLMALSMLLAVIGAWRLHKPDSRRLL